MGWIDSRQQRIRREGEICAYLPGWCLPQTGTGTGCTRSGKGQGKPLLCTEIRANRQAQRQEAGHYRHCQNDFDGDLFNALHRRSVEPCRSFQNRYTRTLERAAACQSH